MDRIKCPGQCVLTFVIATVLACFVPFVRADGPVESALDGPDGVRVSVKMIGPVTQTTDLQIVCVLKHNPSGDQYIEAMKDFNEKLRGLIFNLRSDGEFTGDVGETLLFAPPSNSIKATRVLLIGVGEEPALTLDTLRLVGRIAAREAVRLNAAHVSFAPALRDQGSTRIEVGDGDAAVAGQFLLAYDTEKSLQDEDLSPKFQLDDLTIEAGPKYFGSAVAKVSEAVAAAGDQIKHRSTAPNHLLLSAK
jgi:hypothetical protein